MPKYLRFISFLVILLTLTLNYNFAGTTGKIAGRVTDSETGESLPGINILIEGTTMGAATDIDGNFVIINIPPGNYNVIASGVGFQKKQFVNVKVAVDFTTRLDFQMSTEVISVETIVVQAEAPLVRKDLTSSHTTVDAGQIESLPVESISQLLTLQAGITRGAGGELHIRGGRSTEISYTVNGVSISNPFDNSRTVEIATNAIQELSVVSGTFNAEYGNALSGVVNTVTKEGGNDYRGYISFYTGDNISTRDDLFFNIDDVDPVNNYVVELTLGGPFPILKDQFSFFVSGRYDNDKGWLYGVREHLPTDSVYKNPLNPNDIRVAANGDNQIVSMNPSKTISTTAKLTFKPITTMKINYDIIYSNSEYQFYNHDLKYNPDANYNNYDWGLLNSLEIRHALSNSTFYTLKGSYNLNDFQQYLYPLVGGDFHAGMTLDTSIYRPDPRYQPDHKNVTAATYTFASGGTLNGHYYQRSSTIAAKFDINSQLNNNHELKAGVQFKTHQLNYETFAILRDSVRYLNPTIPGTNTPNHDSYLQEPTEFSAYIQDKMEFESIIINVGLRYDYFDANAMYSTNIFYPSPNYPTLPPSVDKNALLADSDIKHQLSPRLGVSFPITDQGIIHFSYGHFFQIPPFQYLYANSNFKYSLAAGTPLFGNANLNPEKTVTYELGLQQQLSDDIAFNLTGFFKDVRDLLAMQQIRISGNESYLKYVNKDYGNIKGITFSLTKRRTAEDFLGATLDYTFQVAEGNETGADAFFLDLSSGRQSEKIPVYLAWDQTHTLNATVTVGNTDDWYVTLVGRIGSGLPYTPQISGNQVYLRTNSGRRPSQANVDLLAEKTLDIFGLDISFFIKIFNLFDNLNENLVYNDTGRANYTLVANQGPAQATDKLAEEIPGVKSATEYFVRPQYYLSPREVRFGLSFEF